VATKAKSSLDERENEFGSVNEKKDQLQFRTRFAIVSPSCPLLNPGPVYHHHCDHHEAEVNVSLSTIPSQH
jgi:hypothetical protein